MRHLAFCSALSPAIILALVGKVFGQNETGPESKQAEQTVAGTWQADSITLLGENGERKTFSKNNAQGALNVVISDKTITMRMGNNQFAEMAADFDAETTPCTVDAKYLDQDMRGIYELKGDRLIISMNNVKKGRSLNFKEKDNDVVLALNRFPGAPILMIGADGSNPHPLLFLPDYTDCNSPNWSHDGGKIAFDCWRGLFGDPPDTSHIFVADADGTSAKDLGDGAMPSWSPDSKRIVYSRYAANRGIWIMNADGTDSQLIDPDGWSADWSPKKDELAYVIPDAGGENLCVRDLKSEDRRNLLEKQYAQVFWSLSWSPDGQWICFMGRLPDGGAEVAMVSAQGQSKGFKILLPNPAISGVKRFENYPAWSPDGKQILLSMIMEGDSNLQLYLLDADGKTQPKKLVGIDPSRNYYDSCWSPDGKRILMSSWPGVPVEK